MTWIVLEAHKAGRRHLIEMVVNLLIPIFAVSNIPSKAPHRLGLSIGTVHLEDIGELPGSDEGHSEPVDGRSRYLKVGVLKCQSGILDGFDVIARAGPLTVRHRLLSCCRYFRRRRINTDSHNCHVIVAKELVGPFTLNKTLKALSIACVQ